MMKHILILTLFFFFSVLSFAQPSCVLAKYYFDGNANDSSGNSNHLNVSGATLTEDRYGRANKAYHFDGKSHLYTNVGAQFSPDEVSIAFWAKPTKYTYGQSPRIIAVGPPNSYGHSYSNVIEWNANTIYFYGFDVNLATMFSAYVSSPYSDGVWTHIVSIYKKDTIKIYVDGVLNHQSKPAKPISRFTTTQLLQIGGVPISGNLNHGFRGDLDDVFIYCKALSSKEVEQVYKSCKVTVTSDPKDQTVKLGETATFDITTADSTSQFKWQIKKNGIFTDLIGSQYTGAKSAHLKVTNVSPGVNNNQEFRCLAFNTIKGGCSDTSNSATLKVGCVGLLKEQPQSLKIGIAENATFYISKVFSSASVNWQIKDSSGFQDIIIGQKYLVYNKDTLRIQYPSIDDNNKEFRAIINLGGCKDTTMIASLNVHCKPLIEIGDSNKKVRSGSDIIFRIKGFYPDIKYKWQLKKDNTFLDILDNEQFNGASTDSLNIIKVKVSNNEQIFRCIANGYGCTDTLDEVLLTVICDTLVKEQPKNVSDIKGASVQFSVTSFSDKVYYFWQTDLGKGFQNLIDSGQYKGTKTETLTVLKTGINNDKQKFRCILREIYECEELSDIATFNLLCKPQIKLQPKNILAKIGTNAIFVTQSFDTSSHLQWQKKVGNDFLNLSNSAQYFGVNKDSLFINNLTIANDSQNYRCILESMPCFDTSNIVNLIIEKEQIDNAEIGDNYFQIYPNPSNSFIVINSSFNVIGLSYEIIDQQGRVLLSGNSHIKPLKIDIKSIEPGIYYLLIKSSQNRVFKFVKL